MIGIQYWLTHVMLKSGTRVLTSVTLIVLTLSFLSPNIGTNQAPMVAGSLTTAQRQSSLYDYVVILEPAEATKDKAGHLLGEPSGCAPCDP